jgi:hypothetical protein
VTVCSHCTRPAVARGYCSAHYQRWKRTGSATGTSRPTLRDRFLAKVVIPDDDPDACWGWTGIKEKGYSRISVGHSPVQAQRVAYELFVGPIPEDYEVDHTCRNPECTNPRHLEAVTKVENLRRAAAAWTHCRKGHEFTPENIGINTHTGRRYCRTCVNAGQRRRYRAPRRTTATTTHNKKGH